MKHAPSFGAALVLALAACSPADPADCLREAGQALGASDYATARAKYDEALETLEPGSATYIDAKLGLVEALIPSEPQKAVELFLATAASFPVRVGEKEFVDAAAHLVSARKFSEGFSLLQVGFERFGKQSPQLVLQLERIKKAAATDSALMSQLHLGGYM